MWTLSFVSRQIAESRALSYGCSTPTRRQHAHAYQPLAARGLGNPAGRLRGSRNALSEEVISALLRDFRQHGQKAVARVRRTQPAAYLKILALLVPREMKVEHAGAIKAMSDEQLEAGIEAIQRMLETRSLDDKTKVIEGTAETVALPAPTGRQA